MTANVLVYRLGSLGDTVIVLPAFHLVREAFPSAPLSLLTNVPVNGKAAPVADVLGPACPFEEVLAYPAGTRSVGQLMSLIAALRRRSFSHCVYLAKPKGGLWNVRRDALLFRIAGIRRLIGFPKTPEDLLGHFDPVQKRREWDCTRTLRCLAELGQPDLNDDAWWDLLLSAEEERGASEAVAGLGGQRFVSFSIGTKASSNDWEDQNWRPFLTEFRRRHPSIKSVFLGSADEAARCGALMAASGMDGVNLCGAVTPRVAAGVLKRSALFVGHDSGPMHLAACVGTPAVAIFSARNLAEEWYPRGRTVRNRILYHDTDCAGCGLVECIAERKRCILSITVDEVLQACHELMPLK